MNTNTWLWLFEALERIGERLRALKAGDHLC